MVNHQSNFVKPSLLDKNSSFLLCKESLMSSSYNQGEYMPRKSKIS